MSRWALRLDPEEVPMSPTTTTTVTTTTLKRRVPRKPKLRLMKRTRKLVVRTSNVRGGKVRRRRVIDVSI
jgi:hypothetical protein